ncbi:MAG TPA: hypothetical protein VMP38_05015 [Candidatus Acidoferrum sp.]|nr:hypothetical protein [Candidatus Acidoferrum sp.]
MRVAILNQTPDVRDGAAGDLDAAALFAIVWDAIAEVLGTGATAAIVRRAAARAAPDSPELMNVVVLREKLDYRYTLPLAWSHTSRTIPPEERTPIAFRALIAEIGRLLVELTGTVFIGRLEQIPELSARGLVWRTEEAN